MISVNRDVKLSQAAQLSKAISDTWLVREQGQDPLC